jgi:hypothetical protein
MTEHAYHSYRLVASLFVRLLGVFYLIAFLSIAVQIEALAGSQGILPFADRLAELSREGGITIYLQVPTLFWLADSDAALFGAAVAGCVFSLLIVVNLMQRLSLATSFALYLSLYHAGQIFMTFQWDGLLLEAGFLAIFLRPDARVVILLFRWLLFRLRFMSGLSKLTSQDPSWADLNAVRYYFEVQPLPTPLAWYAHQLPDWLLRAGTAGTLFVELVVPFLMFLPRRWRLLAAWLTILWQVLIIVTSNHNWFNFLTIVLCLFLFDDRALQRVVPAGLQRRLLPAGGETAAGRPGFGTPGLLLAGFVLTVSAVHFVELVTLKRSQGPIGVAMDYVEAWRVVNKYHVFPTMPTERIELAIEGSHDGVQWEPYVFRYKPGPLDRAPPVVMPHHPRLDWRMWFVPQNPVQLPWFERFLRALLDNSPPVVALLDSNPFADRAPRFIRVHAYRYRFTDAESRPATGDWWQRESLGAFLPLPWVSNPAPRD